MNWLPPVKNLLNATWQWVRHGHMATQKAILFCVLLVLLCQGLGYHQKFMPWMPASGDDFYTGWVEPPWWALFVDYTRPYMKLMLMLGSILVTFQWVRVAPDLRKMVLPLLIFFGGLTFLSIISELYTHWQEDNFGFSGEPKSAPAYFFKLVMLFIIMISPPFVVWWYSARSLLERYTLQTFLQTLVFCFFAFASLWILMDLIDVMKDFQEAKIPMSTVAVFYIELLPFIYVSVAPAALLLSVLYSLTKMSRSNEIVSMLTAGRSLGQILKPLFVAGAYAGLISMAANYYWAPRGEGRREAVLKSTSEKQTGTVVAANVMFHNDETNRTWYVGRVPFDLLAEKMRSVEVRQLDEKGRLVHGWYASGAKWWTNAKMWSFYSGVEVEYHLGVAKKITPFAGEAGKSRLDIEGWPEKPWDLMSASLLPDNLSVPELTAYINANAALDREKLDRFRVQFFQRFASPWQCFVVVLMAAPLGISFSRRGALGGIASSVFIFFGLLFMDNLFVSMAKGGRMPAALAVWMPCLILGAISFFLFRQKSQNKEMPRLSIGGLIRWFKSLRTA